MEQGHAWSEARAALVRTLVAGVASPGAKVLDAGCGTGAFASALAADGFSVSAMDAELCGALPPHIEYSQGDLTSLPFGDEAFDLVLLLDVLEHVEDESAALGQVRRVLKPGGAIVATVPALKNLWSRRDELAGHVRRYERTEFLGALEGAGFEIEREGFWAALTLPLLRASRRLSRSREGLLRAEERPPGPLTALLRPVLQLDVRLALARGWDTGSSLYAVGRRPE